MRRGSHAPTRRRKATRRHRATLPNEPTLPWLPAAKASVRRALGRRMVGAAPRVPPLTLKEPRAPQTTTYAPPGADVEGQAWRPAPPGPASSLYVQDEFSRAADRFASARPPVQQQAPAPTHSDADVADVFSFARHNRVQDIERLLVRGVPADSRDVHGNTIAIVGAQNGHKRVVKAALRRGADVNAVNLRGNTCLHFCFAFGFVELGEYLITKGADNRIVNASGKTCYEGLG